MEPISSREAGQMNLNLPHDVVTLPSQGVFYKNKKKSLKVGYLTAADENYITSYMSGKRDQDNFVLTLLRGKIYETDIKPEELLEGDIEALLIFLRNTSFGSDYNLTITDPETGKQFNQTIILDELNIKRPENEPDSEGLFKTKLPKTGAEVKLRLLTYHEIIELNKNADDYPIGRVAPIVTWRLNKQIVEVNGSRDREMIVNFVETLPIMDSKHIREFVKKNEPRLDLSRQIMTPSGNKVNVSVTFGVEFFRVFF